MDKVDAFIESILQHEAAPRIYDPVKAHEYYMRTRELKGRRSGAALKTKQQKEGWEYVKSEVAKNKAVASYLTSAQTKAIIEKIKADVKQRREELSKKMKDLIEKNKGFPPPPKLPENATKAQKAKHAEDVAKYKEDRARFNESSRAERAKISEERGKVSADLKSSVEKARAEFKTAMEGIKAKYESELTSEFNALKSMKTKRR